MSSTLTGSISFHPRGFGFVTERIGDVPRRGFVSPPLLNSCLDGDEVTAEFTPTSDGRLTVQSLVRTARNRRIAVGEVVKNSHGTFIKLDALIGNTNWPLLGAETLAVGTLVRVGLDSDGLRFTSPVVIDGKRTHPRPP
jgi:exoribonuclease R